MTSDRDRLQKTRDFQLGKMYERMTKKQQRDYENCEINEKDSEKSFSREGTDKNLKRWKQWAEQGKSIQTDSRLIDHFMVCHLFSLISV